MTVIAFDFGTKRIGVAVGQAFTGTAQPLTQVTNNNQKIHWQAIDDIIEEWRPAELVVGLPLNMDDTDSKISIKAKKFAKQLEEHYSKPTHLVDERLSSREAKDRLEQTGKTRYSKEQLNSMAAVVILEGYFAEQH